MQHFYIITNEPKDKGLELTEKLKSLLIEKGKDVSILVRKKDGTNLTGLSVPEDTECIIVLGGDGTLLRAAVDTMNLDIPLIGINLGTLGFMAEVERGGIKEAVDALCDGRYSVEERMMLDGKICHKGEEDNGSSDLHALNDIVLTRTGSLKIVSYDVYVNGALLSSYEADGIIISTPTGSTGYNMSAGGPIVSPSARLLLVTPICPHAITAKSIVLSAEDVVEIKITNGKNGDEQEAECNVDGYVKGILKTGDRIRIGSSGRVTKFVKLSDDSFLKLLHRKLS